MKKILITGGAGLIGIDLCKLLLNKKYNVVCFDLQEQIKRNETKFKDISESKNFKFFPGSILDRSALNSAMEGVQIIFHLAAMLGVQRTEEQKLKCLEINICGTENVLQSSLFAGVNHIIFASSSEVYGEPRSNPITELTETQGKTVYAVSKLAGEEYIKGYNQLNPNLDYTIVRFFNTYGENQVSQFFLTKVVRKIMNNESPEVYGDGLQERSFCHVEDSCNALLKIIETDNSKNKVYNIGNSNQVYSLKRAAEIAINVLKKPKIKIKNIPFSFSDRNFNREIFKRYCDTTLAKMELGFEPKISLEEGIIRISTNKNYIQNW